MRSVKRTLKYRLIVGLERVNNRLTRWALRRGLAHKAFALLETTGRASGLPRHTPLPYRGDAWIGRRMASTPLTIRIDLD